MAEPKENESPLPPPDIKPQLSELPICGYCGNKIEKVRWMDYGEIRVVMHDRNSDLNCSLGVIKI